MKLHHKTLIAIGFTIVSLLVLLMAFWRGTLLTSYADFEIRDTQHDLERAGSALWGSVDTLNDHLNDWAAWDDPHDYMTTRDPQFVQDNLSDPLIMDHDLGVHLMALAAPDGQIVFKRAIEPDAHPARFTRFPEGLLPHLRPGSPLSRFTEILSHKSGIVMLPEGPLMVAAQPIARTGHKGPINGAMIWGRFLTDAKLKAIGEATHLSLSLKPLSDPTLPRELQAAVKAPSPNTRQDLFVQALSEEQIAGYLLAYDLYGKPAFVLKIDRPRTIYQQGLQSVNQSMGLLMLGGVVFGAVIMILMRKIVLERLAALSKSLQAIGNDGDLAARVTIPGSDELSSLAGTINGMLSQLETSQAELVEKEVLQKEIAVKDEFLAHLTDLNHAYERFVPHEFLRFLDKHSIVDVQLGDQVLRNMSVLFSDIRSFTTLSETMSPRENFNFLNSYLSRVGPVVREHRGFIDKYIGDAIMALFPEGPDDAVRAAIEMQRTVRLYNQHRANSGYQPIAIGIGLHFGDLMLGTIGEEKRMEGTVISDAVNLASRLENLTKQYGVRILLSAAMLERLEGGEQYHLRHLDIVRVKGKQQAVSVYDLFDADDAALFQHKVETREDFERAVRLYHIGDLAIALPIFQEIALKHEGDHAAQLYVRRCQQREALEAWEGVEIA